METAKRIVLITGATGKQGGAVTRHLLGKGFTLKALTRKPESPAAEALATQGVEIVRGDLDDNTSVRQALAGAWGVFSVQNSWEAGVQREEEQGKRLARLAREAGVQHFVYSSVASAQRKTGIPHFESKWRIEETVRGLDFPSHVILRPVFFMENIPSPWFLQADRVVAALGPQRVLQMIAVDDIGKFGAVAFERAEELNRRELDLAGDAVTLSFATAILGQVLNRKLSYVPVPVSEVRKTSEDFAVMMEWLERVGYDADIDGTARALGVKPIKLIDWMPRTYRMSAGYRT
jgi:uncharacterized protein YbjT (DUF2867 family)